MPPPERQHTPMWERIANNLRAQIVDGTVAPGQQLPTEATIMARYEVARATARQALRQLINEGLAVTQPPYGYFVRDRKPFIFRPRHDIGTEPEPSPPDRHPAGFRHPDQAIEVAIVLPPREVAERLGLTPGELAAVRRRIHRMERKPLYLSESYFPLAVVQGTEIMRPDAISTGIYRVLAEHGYPQHRAVDEIFVRMPVPEEVRLLKLEPGTPVAYHLRTGQTGTGTPVCVLANVLPGDRYLIRYETPDPAVEPGAAR
jgi:GntR family transcriptional regulator